jgi:acylphosphatase
VQGVGFRATVRQLARGLSVTGFVRNESDGSVYLEVQGPDMAVSQLLERVRTTMAHFIRDELASPTHEVPSESGFIITH